MQVLIRHSLPEKLVLPIGYHHILQAIIYQSLNPSFGYSGYIHETGIGRGSAGISFLRSACFRESMRSGTGRLYSGMFDIKA